MLEWLILCVFLFGLQHWISPHSQLVAELELGKIQPSVVFSGAPETLTNHSLPTGSISPWVFYISGFIGCTLPPCNRAGAIFSYVGPNNFPCFHERRIPLVFHLKYFLLVFVKVARCCVSQMILAVCTLNLFKALFLQVVRVLFTTFVTCMSSSTDFPVVSIFLAFEAPQWCWNTLLNSLKTIANLYLLRSMGLVKCQDVSVSLDSFFTSFSNGDSSYIYHFQYSQGWCYLLFCS